MKVIIIGGVAGGATAAARLRRNDEHAQIILVERGPYISFANCGLPYHISGTIATREQLLVTTEAGFTARYRVDVRSGTEALAIDRGARSVRLRRLDTGEEYLESYDRLLLAPGSEPLRPAGTASTRAFTLRNIPDLDRIIAHLRDREPRRAVVVGGGFIGLEMLENLHQRGLAVSLVEAAPHLLPPLDTEMAALVQAHLRDKGVELHLGVRLAGVEDRGDHACVRLEDGREIDTDMVVLALGVRPEVALARAAGLELGPRGGIRVDAFLQTSDASIYAVGDAIEVRHAVSGREALIPLAGPANRQGRLAADNMLCADPARRQPCPPTLGTAILKVFDLAAASTGMSEEQLRAAGVACRSTITHGGSHASYYPGASVLSLKLCWDDAGRILGAQAVGADGVDKRIDVIATAMRAGMSVRELADLELAYAPPFGSAKDPVNVAAHVACNVLDGRSAVLDWRALRELRSGPLQLVDVRTPQEFARGSIPGARNIPLDGLRESLGELDPARPTVVFCQVGLRGYLALRVLRQRGFADVRNLSGGYRSWAALD